VGASVANRALREVGRIAGADEGGAERSVEVGVPRAGAGGAVVAIAVLNLFIPIEDQINSGNRDHNKATSSKLES
jgi:hypothetical protein